MEQLYVQLGVRIHCFIFVTTTQMRSGMYQIKFKFKRLFSVRKNWFNYMKCVFYLVFTRFRHTVNIRRTTKVIFVSCMQNVDLYLICWWCYYMYREWKMNWLQTFRMRRLNLNVQMHIDFWQRKENSLRNELQGTLASLPWNNGIIWQCAKSKANVSTLTFCKITIFFVQFKKNHILYC